MEEGLALHRRWKGDVSVSTFRERTGQRFALDTFGNGWTVVKRLPNTRQGKVLWLCRHDDGRQKGLITCKVIRMDRERRQ